MLQELKRCNEGLGITQITKLDHARKFKCVYKKAYMANNCLKNSNRMFGMSFPARFLSAQKPKGSNIQRSISCFRCYATNVNSVRVSPKPLDFTVCSVCLSTDHNRSNCTSTTKNASTAIESTEQCQVPAPHSKKPPALKQVCKVTAIIKRLVFQTMTSPTDCLLKLLETALRTLSHPDDHMPLPLGNRAYLSQLPAMYPMKIASTD